MNTPTRPHLTDTVVDTVLVSPHGSDVGVKLTAATGGGYDLWWTDFVANDWTEHYDTLAPALARLALLAHSAAGDWHDCWFENDPDGFAASWASFAAGEVN